MSPVILNPGYGYPGLEARHEVRSPNGQIVLLNDQAAVNRYKLDAIPNLYSRAESEDNRSSKVGRHGEVIYPSYKTGKTFTYEGRTQCRNLFDLQAVDTALRGACSEPYLETEFRLTHNPALATGEWRYWARIISFTEDARWEFNPRHARSPFQRRFVIGVRMSDDRFYFTTGYSDLGPFNAEQAITPGGNAATDPLIHATVAAGTTVTLTNLDVNTAAGTARLRFNALPAGLLSVDFKARTATIAGANAMGYFDDGYSQWWDEAIPGLLPGTNRVNVTGGTNWRAIYTPASV